MSGKLLGRVFDSAPSQFLFLGPHDTKDLVYEVEINTENQLRKRITDAANQIRNNPKC
jgi:hypothetical protein